MNRKNALNELHGRLRALPPLWPVVLGLSLLAAAFEGVRLYRIDALRADLKILHEGRDLPIERRFGARDEVVLARASYLANQGRYDDALELLNRLSGASDRTMRQSAFFDLGNLHLRRALEQAEKLETLHAIPLLELAKNAYRQALTLDPADWDAKYNLEFAMRLLPEMARRDTGQSQDDEEPPEDAARRNWTTLPGFPRGLP
jgi:mxaK protein